MSRFAPLVALLILVSILSGCDRRAGEKRQIEETVRRYNQLLTQGYESLNMTPLTEVAETEQATKVYSHMAALGEARTKMYPTLRDIAFSDFRFSSVSSAAVTTRESWDFRHVNIDSGTVTHEEKGFVYRLAYRLALRGGRWMVREVASMEGNEKGSGAKR
ncbi:hypothetical protein [Geobacter pickeringii]|uniref:hypothetical protein n=1 Tax=Geobacter pickeringii TaxID=345632 RepID=UPI000690E833|nr:hypothetical protein [Geobacter pickeringii]